MWKKECFNHWIKNFKNVFILNFVLLVGCIAFSSCEEDAIQEVWQEEYKENAPEQIVVRKMRQQIEPDILPPILKPEQS